MTYEEAVAHISSLSKRGWRLGLDRMQELTRRLGNPHIGGPNFIHIAGTNGKGSVTAMVQSVLKEAGFPTGGFFSPYVYDFRERIQFDCDYIEKADVARLTARILPVAEQLEDSDYGGPTEFEFKTALGFEYWREKKCRYVALEVGLGGRLDATNIVEPIVSVITDISLDHTTILGDTIAAIAAEKAGIIKRGRPCVTVATSLQALTTIEERATELGSPIWRLGHEIKLEQSEAGWVVSTPCRTREGLRTNLLGSFQGRNIAACVAALDAAQIAVDCEAIKVGLDRVRLPGRMEVVCISPTIVFDGAHNPSALANVAWEIRRIFNLSSLAVVYSAATGHDIRASLEALRPYVNRLHLCQMQHQRSASSDAIEQAAKEAGITDYCYSPSVRAALARAVAESGDQCAILVTGSFYLLAEAKSALHSLASAPSEVVP